MFHALVRSTVRRQLRASGAGFAESFVLAAKLSAQDIDDAVQATPEAVGQIGDGSILKKIEEFLASPLGQSLISLLAKLLLGA